MVRYGIELPGAILSSLVAISDGLGVSLEMRLQQALDANAAPWVVATISRVVIVVVVVLLWLERIVVSATTVANIVARALATTWGLHFPSGCNG